MSVVPDKLKIFTIGYATKPVNIFVDQLHENGISVVADVRSVPYSKTFFDYHRENIKNTLRDAGIQYVYLGEELGPRSKDHEHYDQNNQVQFDLLMQASLFREGIERLHTGVKRKYLIALMCAEKDPAICHRSLLIGYYLSRQIMQDASWFVQHICHDGAIETQTELERRIAMLHSNEVDLFMDEEERNSLSYKKQLKLTSYIKKSE